MPFARLFVLAFACAGVLPSQETGRVQLDELVKEALERNPEVLAAQKRYEALAQRSRGESALPDPMVSLGYNSSGNPLPGAGLGREPVANIGFMVTQEFPYPGKRDLRVKMANKEAQAEWETYLLAQLGIASRVKQAYYRLQHTYAMEDVIARNRQILERMLKVAETRYSVGKAMQQDVFKTQTQISILETRRVQFERERRAAEAELNTLLRRALGSPVVRPSDPEIHELLPPLEEILAHAREHSPMLMRDQRMIERGEVAAAMSRKEWYPDFALTGGYYNMGSMPPMYMFRADVKIPLWGRKQRAGITEQANALTGSRRTYEATQNNLQFRLKEDYLMAESALKLMNLYSNTVIPQSNLALESSLTTYQTGTADFMAVLTNFMTSVEYEMNYHEEMQNFHLALTRMEEMSAKRLIGTESHQ